MSGAWKSAHICPNSRDDLLSANPSDPRNRIEPLENRVYGGKAGFDLGFQGGDAGLQGVDPLQLGRKHEALVGPNKALHGLADRFWIGLEGSANLGGYDLRAGFASNQRLEHGPARHAQDVVNHTGGLDVGALEHLVNPI